MTWVDFEWPMGPDLRQVDGEVATAQAVARRFEQPIGGWDGDRSFGMNLRDFIGDQISDADLVFIEAAGQEQCEADPRVARARFLVKFDEETNTLDTSAVILTDTGNVVTVRTATSEPLPQFIGI